jgi:predicted nucleic acid-binding protein|tara:strand:+ start:166 stop:339 length:174 start_codon:yes stop_codon:yes gene_type:complete
MEDNEALEIVIQGNDKHNFNNRVNDKILIALCATLDQYAIYIEDIDLRFNEITDEGA